MSPSLDLDRYRPVSALECKKPTAFDVYTLECSTDLALFSIFMHSMEKFMGYIERGITIDL